MEDLTKLGYAGSEISYLSPCAACALRVFESQEIVWSALDSGDIIYPSSGRSSLRAGGKQDTKTKN